jgi:menaquinone-dependent protoporphyrinogen oxidase
MAAIVLLAHASRYGSTQEVAEAVAATLRVSGLEVEVKPAREVKTLEGYGPVVLGTAIYMVHLHKDARRFLSRHEKALRERPVAFFAMGPFHDDEKEWQGVRTQIEKELAKYPWFAPVTQAAFGGKFDPAALRFPYNLLPALKNLPGSDVRDWKAIRAWAESLAAKLQPGWSSPT